MADFHSQAADSRGPAVQIEARRYSEWALDAEGELLLGPEGLPQAREGWYGISRTFTNQDAAFLVMDPWNDWADDALNRYFAAVTDAKTLPLMQAAAQSGYRVLILTNDPEGLAYNREIHAGFRAMVDAGGAELLYHTQYTVDSFVDRLSTEGIRHLIYTGYASNLCVLFRELGIASVNRTGRLDCYFIPACSAAIERADTWATGEVHEITTLLISQSQALLIDDGELMAQLAQTQIY